LEDAGKEAEALGELKAKEERFCREYVVDYNGTQAAIRAGYKESDAANRATRLLKKAEVSARIRELQQEVADRLAMSQAYVITQLVQTYNECKEVGDFKSAIRALEAMGKHLGMFDKKPQQPEDPDKLEDLL
jgi:phage terminase small subunit